ncbi:MAG: electron transport complex subunit RsxC [Rikenellaceae bacterium]
MLKSFKIGGIHPCDNKISKASAIEVLPLPKRVVIPLSQHIGAPATALVAKGDKVKVGELIGQSAGFVSSNIHSSVSGTVTSVEAVADTSGMKKMSVIINVEDDEWCEDIIRDAAVIKECSLSAAEIITKIAACGIVGMGGATFPTSVKLTPPQGKKAEVLIINGVECEPYLTADHRVMIERGEELLVGIEILRVALGVNKAYIGIENNKPDAIESLTNINTNSHIEVVPLKVKYPQGGEKQLIDAITSREVPSGALPIDVGAVVQNVGTALAVYEAVQKNKPLFERIVTVTGKTVTNPKNLLVRIGTPVSDLLNYCGFDDEQTEKVIGGGPMMGRAMCNVEGSITKGSSGVLLMNKEESRRPEAQTCIRCGKCVSVCPMGLEPYMIAVLSKKGLFEDAVEHKPNDCIECGSCSFTCPANLPLLDNIRLAKTEVMKILRSKK